MNYELTVKGDRFRLTTDANPPRNIVHQQPTSTLPPPSYLLNSPTPSETPAPAKQVV
jgi:hypothetical protein